MPNLVIRKRLPILRQLVVIVARPQRRDSACFFEWTVTLGQDLVDANADIDFDLGIPGLGFETSGAVQTNVSWSMDLGFGLSFDDGFYLIPLGNLFSNLSTL